MQPNVTDAVLSEKPEVKSCTCVQEFAHGCQSFQIKTLTSLLANRGDHTKLLASIKTLNKYLLAARQALFISNHLYWI